ncbi:phosphate/phosphite/phosphonate ABC transporter substrate-binding protein [Cohaesibacter celericrescens]|uniref:Phosphonate ABC transporter substrate-binding protein n=1 Tax=Cohaesibacter celericrescens TaxID=2067669 RepID=A0A2N5XN48_9HYPH|nr:PhnD/SsuA/transferrin family substrate-binding protein [Cohaesibacter celericrescens]PLW75837.1 hypothetical protein C0081_17185 [Cohaesibacter celericrescens]
MLYKLFNLSIQSMSVRPALLLFVVLASSFVFDTSFVVAQNEVERSVLRTLTVDSNSLTDAIDNPVSPMRDEGLEQSQPLPQTADQSRADGVSDLTGSGNSIELLDHKPPFRIGLMAERGTAYLQTRIEPFRSYLQDSLSRPVEIVAFKSMVSLMAAHTAKQVDYAVYPASVFAMAQASCGCLLPLVAPVSLQAPDGIYMVLVVRGDSGIKSLADMTGRSVALSSKNGAMPFYMALNELRKSGLDADRDLSSVVSQENPQEALVLLEKGEVDAALVWSSTQYNQSLFTSQGALSAYQNAKKGNRKSAPAEPDFLSIWSSPAIPAGPHAVHNDVSKQDRADLVKALVTMNKRDPDAYDAIERHYGAGFKPVTMENYVPLIDIATAK